VVDFNKSCEIDRGLALELSGVAVWYYRCTSCGFLFTPAMDGFGAAEWRKFVYNDDYLQVDPDYAGARAEANAPLVRTIAGQLGIGDPGLALILTAERRWLDYGSGQGQLTALLADLPVERAAWDPFGGPTEGGERPEGQFDLVTAFEVLEHTTIPVETARDALGFVRPGGAFLFSTLVHDEVRTQDMGWYIAPRNGHVSIHSTRSLDILFGALGWNVQHLTPNIHIAMRL
jgi:SAM-dependent methyltransferase